MPATGPTLPDRKTMDPRDFALASALREEFTKLNVSVREYGATHNLHYSTVSCYLSCKRGLPPWAFVKTLVEDAARAHGLEKPSRAMIVYMWTLLKNAEAAREKDSVERLRAELSTARNEAEAHAQRERWINDQLLAAKTHIANLKSQVFALESGQVSPLPRPSTELALRGVEAQLRDQRESAERTIANLRAQLDRERQLKEKAEQDCQRCEKLINQMIAAAASPVAESDGNLPAAWDEPTLEMPAVVSISDEAPYLLNRTAPPYPAELTEWLRSRLDAKDVELDAKNDELDVKEARIAELEDRVSMLLHRCSLANENFLEERDKALYWENCCAELLEATRSRRSAPQSWAGTEPASVREGLHSSPPARAAGPP